MPVPRVILDTDMALDVDDVGALAVLHRLADLGECELLGVVISTPDEGYNGIWAGPMVDVVNRYYGRRQLPIGIARGRDLIMFRAGKYAEHVVRKFPHDVVSGRDLPDAVSVYRRLLAGSPDGSVRIVSVGFLNNLAALLDSEQDLHSPFSGAQLAARKVVEVSLMGGRVPTGMEFNVSSYAGASRRVFADWPTPIMFQGAEFGEKVAVGAALARHYRPEENPVAMAWQLYCGGGDRCAWDQISALYAVRGCADYFEAVTQGQFDWDPTANAATWNPSGTRAHAYLRPRMPLPELAAAIDQLMIARPGAGAASGPPEARP